MPECRHLICDQPAEFEVTVRYFGGVRERKALYCTKHLTVVQEALATQETSEITNIQPLRGTTVSKKDSDFQATITRQEQMLAARNEIIDRLEHETSQYKAGEAHLKDENARLNRSLGAATTNLAHLVRLLHQLADDAEVRGEIVVSDTIDDRLEELSLASRKQEYTIEILVPTRLHVHVTARSKAHARTLYEAGDVDWNVADGEVQHDDVKVLDISEGSL